MKLTFFSNFLNHHQRPLCEEFHKNLGSNFHFVSTMEIPNRFLKGGFEDMSDVVYNINSYRNNEEYNRAMKLGIDSDVVITGSAPETFIKERLKKNKLTFRYGERQFKKGGYQKFHPRVLRWLFLLHTRYRNKNLHMLCNSGYSANDLSWVFAYPNKMFKWGYFPQVEKIHIDKVLANKRGGKLKLLFVARLIPLKHPELLIKLGELLKEKNHNFEINIIGSGVMEDELKRETTKKGLNNHIFFLGNFPNKDVVEHMKNNNVLLFTSDRNEGWGAVINEAMSNGCTVVASHVIGSTPFLIKNGVNGLVFKSENIDGLFRNVERLILNRDFCENLAREAYQTISTTWSPKTAVNNFLLLTEGILNKNKIVIEEGPCSPSLPTPDNWYKNA